MYSESESEIGYLVKWIGPETKWAKYDQVEDKVIFIGGPNPYMWQDIGMNCV